MEAVLWIDRPSLKASASVSEPSALGWLHVLVGLGSVAPSHRKGGYPAGPWGLVCFISVDSKPSGVQSKVMQNYRAPLLPPCT